MDLLNQINVNQMLITALSLSAAGVIGFWVKDVPIKILKFLQQQLLTKLYFIGGYPHNLTYKYIEEHNKNRNFRVFKIGRSFNDGVSIGYGNHIIKYKKRLLFISLRREQTQNSEYDREILVITKFGRDRKLIDEFINEVKEFGNNNKKNRIEIDIFDGVRYQYFMSEKRDINTVFLEKDKKDLLLNTVDKFIQRKEWYSQRGIPYHLGILLYGKPGTGKSSLIKAIASHINYQINYIPLNHLDRLNNAMLSADRYSVIVIEDIDCEESVHIRSNDNIDEDDDILIQQAREKANKNNNKSLIAKPINLSEILNSIDGIGSAAEGKIIFITTNHIEKLDPALIRPGRIDLKVEVNYVNLEILNQFTTTYYNREVDNSIKLRDNITCAQLQNMLLLDKTFEDIIEFIEDKGEESNE